MSRPEVNGKVATAPDARKGGRYCVIIPVYNAAKTIAKVVEAVRQLGLDVLVVDDGSSDQTAIAASGAGALVVSFLKNQGKGAALRAGFTHALRERYDAVITMDGDGQHDPAEIPKLVESASAHQASVVIGNRMADVVCMPAVRAWTNGLMSTIVSGMTRQRIPDSQCGFRFIRSEVLAGLALKAKRYEIETELLFSASATRCKIVSVPIRTIYANEGSHIRPLRDTVRFLGLLTRHLFAR